MVISFYLESEFYRRLESYVISIEEQVENGYPRPDTTDPSKVTIVVSDDSRAQKRKLSATSENTLFFYFNSETSL